MKKKVCRRLAWPLPIFFVLGHDTENCIVTQGSRRVGVRSGTPRHDAVRLRHSQPPRATRPALARDTDGLRAGASYSTHAWPGYGVCHDTNFFIVAGGQ